MLTPHAGELGRLLELDSAEIERERLRHVRAAAEQAARGRRAEGRRHADRRARTGRVAVSPGGSPALATAGTGDVLTGVIAALLATGTRRLHGGRGGRAGCTPQAGREAARRLGAPEGVIAIGRDRRAAAARCRAAGDERRGEVQAMADVRAGSTGTDGAPRAGPRRGSTSPRSSATARACARELRRGAALCAVVKADGYGHGAVQSARAALAGGASWLAVATRREARELREAGLRDARVLVMGALSPVELRGGARGRRRRGRLERALPARRCAAAGGGRVSRQARLRHGAARHARPGRGLARGRRGRGRRPACELAGRDDPLRHRRRPQGRRLLRAPAGRVRALGADGQGRAAGDRSCTRPTAPPRCATPEAQFDMVRCGIAIYGMDPFGRGPRRTGAGAGARAELLRRRGQAVPGGRERRLRAAVRGRQRHLHRRAPDRLRRRLAARSVQQRRRADRRTPLPAGGHREHGQHHRRPRAGARRRAAARRARDPDRHPGQRADHRRGGGPPPGARSTTRSPAR